MSVDEAVVRVVMDINKVYKFAYCLGRGDKQMRGKVMFCQLTIDKIGGIL